MVEKPKKVFKNISDTLKINYNFFDFTPTTLGIPNKGNSSFGKQDSKKGLIYKDSNRNNFPKKYCQKNIFKFYLKSIKIRSKLKNVLNIRNY